MIIVPVFTVYYGVMLMSQVLQISLFQGESACLGETYCRFCRNKGMFLRGFQTTLSPIRNKTSQTTSTSRRKTKSDSEMNVNLHLEPP